MTGFKLWFRSCWNECQVLVDAGMGKLDCRTCLFSIIGTSSEEGDLRGTCRDLVEEVCHGEKVVESIKLLVAI